MHERQVDAVVRGLAADGVGASGHREGAQVTAAIHAGVVVIGGTVHGNITAERKIEIHPTGRLYGNICTPSLVIEEGVIFEGSCTMGRGGAQAGEQLAGEPALEQERLLAR